MIEVKENDLKLENNLNLLFFCSENCIPCKSNLIHLNKIKNELDCMSFFKISLENNKNLFEKHNIYSVPTIIITRELKEIKRVTGVLSYNDLVKFINDLNY